MKAHRETQASLRSFYAGQVEERQVGPGSAGKEGRRRGRARHGDMYLAGVSVGWGLVGFRAKADSAICRGLHHFP